MHLTKGFIFVLAMLSASPSMAQAMQGAPGQANGRAEPGPALDPHVKLAAEQYAELEKDYAPLLSAYLAGTASEDDLAPKFAALASTPGLEDRLDVWVNAYPASYPARLARGLYRVAAAWRLRGDRFVDKTTDNQLKGFTDGLNQATADLNASIKLYARPVWSYTALIMVYRGQGANLDDARRLLDKALKIDPQAYGPRMEYQIMLTPKWGGSVDLLESFAKECNQSAMSKKNKERIEARHHAYVAEAAQLERDYKRASDEYFKAYEIEREPRRLLQSGQSAQDGSLMDLAFQRFDALVKAHPQYPFGYNKRGGMYESQFKNDEKAFKDYMAAAELGNSFAQNRVGWWYMTGKHVAKDYERAELFFRRAADQRNETAIANLASLKALRKTAAATP
ncbi:MAG: DUF4034 domain-containing protein [Aquabacterium sp.]|uniref:DUF4034 domain-containing protein n=1 Tax=Aquabacterium sp. TaxID=1872578 RepID=UPI0025C197EA|nr:DUF4034 domain-containing protein [Aquabacterium sp.]MBI3384481.1 DUF4034 domain-containing protein [Aquabacterium sp.]